MCPLDHRHVSGFRSFGVLQRVVALDTQVFIEIVAPVDLYRQIAQDKEFTPAIRERHRRIAYSLALAWQFHIWRMRTVSHDEELMHITEKVAPHEENSFTTGVVSLFAHDLRDSIFPGWQWRTSRRDLPSGLRGTEVDSALLAFAKKKKTPLITRDGVLAKRAGCVGVRAFQPEEYLKVRHADPRRAVRGLLRRYAEVCESLPLGARRKAMLAYQDEFEAILLRHDFFETGA